ncbi:MAG: hypothetical protein HOP17_08830 [Acidobacteria bacterium]|nr:hypothetical protein [Acidobacteriota bacterium]
MTNIFRPLAAFAVIFCVVSTSFADVTIKQRLTISGQKFESTRQIKGSRERTEQRMEMADPAMAAYMPQVATITQCDLKRRIQVNDRKQLYMIDPFETPGTPVPPSRPTQPVANGPTKKGGTVTMAFSVRDTGERKTMFGLQARHLVVTQEMESSPDSCNGPGKIKTEFDGWYVDFSADFSCPAPSTPQMMGRPQKPDCLDRIVMKASGTAPKGLMLEGTMKMYGADGSVQMSQTTETLELSRNTLDAALFDIPLGYKQASSSQDLYAVSMPVFGAGSENRNTPSRSTPSIVSPSASSKTVLLNISGGAANQSEIDSYVRSKLAQRGMKVISGSADYAVNIQFSQIKESTAGKIGGIFGKVTGVGTSGGKVDIDLSATISGKASGSAKVKNKFDGPLSAALRMAIDRAMDQLLENINQ